jgi:Ca-activated chloride channel family protein
MARHNLFYLVVIPLLFSLFIVLGACSHKAEHSNQPVDNNAQTEPAKHDIRSESDAKVVVLESSAKTRPEPKASTPVRKAKEEERAAGTSAQVAPVPLAGRLRTPSTLDALRWPSEPVDRENYAHFDDNPVKRVSEHPVSTFSIDVDTGSYSNVRRLLSAGQLPRRDAVRVEEMINYFTYDYAAADNLQHPFSIRTEMAPAPWNKERILLQIGLKGYEPPKKQRPAANLVFLIDVSGSMRSADKLGLLKTSLRMLTQQLGEHDQIAIVVYAGASGVVLESTSGSKKVKILQSLDALTAGGSTNGAAGIRLAYQVANEGFIRGGINRVLLATDGDFNVGTVDFNALKDLVKHQRQSGITLTTLGFGSGNYNDHLMEQLADVGNGNYAYIDSAKEAQKVLVEQMTATLLLIAKDVKIQIEFNPAVVSEYRLIGYENRLLRREDFNNDKIDAGDIGAGHSVTALYELTLADNEQQSVDPLRYAAKKKPNDGVREELAFIKLRYKAPDGDTSKLIQQALHKKDIVADLAPSSDNLRFAAAVSGFGQILRGAVYTGEFSYDDVIELANNARGTDTYGYRSDFVGLVRLAKALDGQAQQASTP